jgi:mono/diheme cytochrome c family protein
MGAARAILSLMPLLPAGAALAAADVEAGREVALTWCASCHVVGAAKPHGGLLRLSATPCGGSASGAGSPRPRSERAIRHWIRADPLARTVGWRDVAGRRSHGAEQENDELTEESFDLPIGRTGRCPRHSAPQRPTRPGAGTIPTIAWTHRMQG